MKMGTEIKIERRYLKATDLRMAKTAEDKMPMMSGMPALFNNLSEDLGGFREKIAPGAFTNCLKNCDVRALWNHDSNHVLGRTTSGTLRLKETDAGLQMECDMPDTTMARDLGVSMQRGDVNQMSFGFTVKNDSWDEVNGEIVRTLLEINELFDVSVVTFPAYSDTTVALNSLQAFRSKQQDSQQVDLMVNLTLISEEDDLYGLITASRREQT
jgi:uncharacterized protein